MFSAFNPSMCTHAVAPGEQCLAQGSHLSRGQFLPEPRFEPTTSGYKSNALSTRPRLPLNYCINSAWYGGDQFVALLRCNGSRGCFDSGLQVELLGLVSFIFLLTIAH